MHASLNLICSTCHKSNFRYFVNITSISYLNRKSDIEASLMASAHVQHISTFSGSSDRSSDSFSEVQCLVAHIHHAYLSMQHVRAVYRKSRRSTEAIFRTRLTMLDGASDRCRSVCLSVRPSHL